MPTSEVLKKLVWLTYLGTHTTFDTMEFFTVCTKLAEMALFYLKELTTATKITSSGTQPDARDYYWFGSPMPNHMS